MDVVVAGGTGVVGRPAVTALVADGHRVRVAVRSERAASLVRELRAEPVASDLFDRTAVLRLTAHADVVVNLATSIPPSSRAWRRSAWAANDRLRREASALLADAALEAGAGFLQESFALALPSRPGEIIDESTALDPPVRAATTLDAEASAARVRDAGGRGVVLRFGWFLGPTAPQAQETLKLARRTHVAFLPGEPTARLPVVDPEDAGRAVAAALLAPSGTYHVVDDESLPRSAHADVLSRLLGEPIRLPPRLAAKGPAEILARDLHLTNRRLREVTGWVPLLSTARESWAATVAASRPGRTGG